MTIRLGTHVSLTITSDATTFQPCKQQQIVSGNELLLVLIVDDNKTWYPSLPTISSDAATLHVCKQQQIASGNKYYLNILVSNWLIVLLMTIRLNIHVSLTITSDATTFKACKNNK